MAMVTKGRSLITMKATEHLNLNPFLYKIL
jgi:hypothetical protein